MRTPRSLERRKIGSNAARLGTSTDSYATTKVPRPTVKEASPALYSYADTRGDPTYADAKTAAHAVPSTNAVKIVG